jgi:hypothetical protein
MFNTIVGAGAVGAVAEAASRYGFGFDSATLVAKIIVTNL